jgi:hypothetical protein
VERGGRLRLGVIKMGDERNVEWEETWQKEAWATYRSRDIKYEDKGLDKRAIVSVRKNNDLGLGTGYINIGIEEIIVVYAIYVRI